MRLFRQRPLTVEVDFISDLLVRVRYGKDRYLFMTREDFETRFESLVPIFD